MHAHRVGLRALAVLCVLVSGAVLAQSQRPPATDASGRTVVDANGRRLNYSTPAAPRPSAAAAVPSADRIIAGGGSRRVTIQSFPTAELAIGPTYTDQWRLLTWGTGIGLTGFWPIDIDNDGTLEFVTGGGWQFGRNDNWSIVDYDAARQEYELLWQSPASPGPSIAPFISAMRVVETGTTKRIWLGYTSGSVVVIDALTRTTFVSRQPANTEIRDLAVADADNDGTLDVVALTGTAMYFFNAETADPGQTVARGGDRLAVGNVDGDTNVEIVINTGQVLEVTSSSTTVELDGASFGFRVSLADIDGDSMLELVAAEGWYTIRAWDLDIPVLKWSHPTSHDIGALRLFDVTGDGVHEVLYGDGQWGAVHALSGTTGNELWTVTNSEHGVTDIAVFDADHDGDLELLYGSGWSSTGPDYLYVYDLATRTREWQNRDFIGPYYAVDAGDADGDGQLEFVVASLNSQSGYGGSVISVVNAVTHELEWQTSVPFSQISALRIANIDSDPQPEIILGSGDSHLDSLHIIDGLTHTVQLRHQYTGGLNSLEVADVDGDGTLEIVAGNRNYSTPGHGTFINVINPTTGDLIWSSPTLASTTWAIRDVLAADLGSPGMDVVALGDSIVYRLRWSDKQLLTTSGGPAYRSIGIADVLNQGQRHIVAGRTDGSIDVLDPTTLALVRTISVCSGPVPAVHEHGPGLLAFACGSTFGIYDVGAESMVTQTTTSVSSLGEWGSIVHTTIGGKSAYLLGGYQAIELLDVGGNDVPSVQPGSYSFHWRNGLDIQLAGSDPNGDALTFELFDLPRNGSLLWTNRPTGSLRYSVLTPLRGTDVFHVRSFDGYQHSAPQAISLTLTNTVPTANTSALSFHWRGTQTATLGGTDADSDPLTFTIGTTPQTGTFTLTNPATGEVQFTPAGAFVGSDALSYQVSDSVDTTAAQNVQVNLTNTTPTAAAATYDITVGTTLHARVNGQDANADPLTYEVVQQATKGTFTLEAATGLFQYVPGSTGSGTDTVTVAASDGISRSPAVTIEFRYPGASGGGGGRGGGGGGSLEWLTLFLLLAGFSLREHRARARARARAPETNRHGPGQ